MTVAPPAADGAIVDEGVVGEYQLIYLLAQALEDSDAFAVAQAWGGSRYVTWTVGRRACTRVRFATHSPEADQVLAAALRFWSETRDAGVTVATIPVTLTACHPAA